MKKKYLCPLCGSQLEAWQEVVYYRVAKINPNTGMLNKTRRNTEHEDMDTMCGFMCSNDNCGFSINSFEEIKEMDKYEYLYDIDLDDL